MDNILLNLKAPKSSNLINTLQSISKAASILPLSIGCIVFIGWIFDIQILKTVLPGLVTMKTNTAIISILGGVSMLLLHQQPVTKLLRRTIQAFAVIILLIGLLTLVEHGTGWDLGIDQLLFKESATAVATSSPNRMAPNTALVGVMFGSALLLLSQPRPNYRLLQFLAIGSFLIAWLAIIGYAYGISNFYGIGSYTKMALNTAVAYAACSIAILLFRPDRGFITVVTSEHAGGIMAKGLFPAAIGIPPIMGWLLLLGNRSGFYDSEVGLSLTVILDTIIFATLIWINARFLGKIDNQLQQAEEQSRIFEIAAAQAEQLQKALQELGQTQAQLIQSEKMSSLGQMVAGVAHEINNPVNFIYGNLTHVNEYTQDLLSLIDLYQERIGESDPEIKNRLEEIDLDFLIEDLPKTLSSMKVGADRIRKIVLTLRNFSRLDEAEMKAVNIHEGIDSTLLILQNRLKGKPERPGIQIIKEYGDLPEVECYASQLNQVFMNITNNAIDALQEAKGNPEETLLTPTITISTKVLQQNRVGIRIKDNGPGMTETVKQRLFDPFFTTKPVGAGTGLGLSISHQIVVEKHGGRLECRSQPGQGAEFWMEIPIRQTSN